jgi:hypothetical protein
MAADGEKQMAIDKGANQRDAEEVSAVARPPTDTAARPSRQDHGLEFVAGIEAAAKALSAPQVKGRRTRQARTLGRIGSRHRWMKLDRVQDRHPGNAFATKQVCAITTRFTRFSPQ